MIRNLKTLISACTLSILILPLKTQALDYPAALPNNHLKEELEEQNDRLIPKGSWYSASVDGQGYFRGLEVNDFYHAMGYWVQARTEFRPSEMFTLNVRSVFYSGSISGGYTQPTGQYNLFGFSAVWPTPVLGGKLEVRAIDIERQTIGAGLFIEEREMAGLTTKWSRDGYYLKVLLEGTGGLLKGDDLANLDSQFFGGYLGLGGIFWTASKQSGLPYNRKPFYYINSIHSLGPYVDYFVELGFRNQKTASMIGFKGQGTSGRLKYKGRVQARMYDNGVGVDFVQQIENMYVSYDQYDKRYTAAGNILAQDDNVLVYSMVADFDYELNQQWVLQAKNEVGTFDYKDSKHKGFYYYRAGLTYFPLVEREESITLFTSNKVLTDSFKRPPNDYSQEQTLPLFRQRSFYGVEASF
ncbi:MAG: hypothetical protein K2Q18_13870, partial [Bdellovibrionales bacterium]|nr:hypothetical protein [Bdellovibrionales bacterium]